MFLRIQAAIALLWQAVAIFFSVKSKKKITREIYEYFDGIQKRQADPLVLYRKILENDHCNLRDDLAAMADGDWEALDRIIRLIRETFGIKPLEEGGLTQYECDELLGDFLHYITIVKKKRKASRTRSPRSASESSTESAKSTTKRSVVLSGTQSESKDGEATKCSPQSAQAQGDSTKAGSTP